MSQEKFGEKWGEKVGVQFPSSFQNHFRPEKKVGVQLHPSSFTQLHHTTVRGCPVPSSSISSIFQCHSPSTEKKWEKKWVSSFTLKAFIDVFAWTALLTAICISGTWLLKKSTAKGNVSFH
jgi:hypothetical protein